MSENRETWLGRMASFPLNRLASFPLITVVELCSLRNKRILDRKPGRMIAPLQTNRSCGLGLDDDGGSGGGGDGDDDVRHDNSAIIGKIRGPVVPMECRRASLTTATPTTTESPVPTTDAETARISSSPLYRRNMTPDKRSSGSVYCRICHEDGSVEELIDPCECAGTLGLIHTSCLEKWLSTSNTDRCEICKYKFVIQKKNKPLSQSFWQWWSSRSIHGLQGIAGDVICLIVLTPLCIAATYLCGIGASAYMRLGFWEGTGLAVLCCMLVATYCLWLVVTVRFHFKSWQQWCRRNQDVKLVVKHKHEEGIRRESRIRTFWVISQDSNNNRSENVNRFTAWLLASFGSNEDPLYSLQQQQSTVV